MNKQFTAIYDDSWMSGSHRSHITKFRRFEQRDGETMEEALQREDIDYPSYIFVGHPKLEGEEE